VVHRRYSFGDPVPFVGPQTTGDFPIVVPECGMYNYGPLFIPIRKRRVKRYAMIGYYTIIEFSCEPVADAGPDVNVCDDLCASLNGTVTVLGEVRHPLPIRG